MGAGSKDVMDFFATNVENAVSSFREQAFAVTCESLLNLESIMSAHEDHLVNRNIDLASVVAIYEHFDFPKFMLYVFQSQDFKLVECLILHLQQLVAFVEFHGLFESEFFLPAMIECFVRYKGERFIQFMVLLNKALPLQAKYDENLSCIHDHLEDIFEGYKRRGAIVAWLEFLVTLLDVLPMAINEADNILKTLDLSEDVYDDRVCLHSLYLIVTKMLTTAQSCDRGYEILSLIDSHESNILPGLLRKPENDDTELFHDRIVLLTQMLILAKGNKRVQRCFLDGYRYDFDFCTVAATEDLGLLPSILKLYDVISADNSDLLFDKVVRTERITEQITVILTDGDFMAKEAVFSFISAMSDRSGMRDFMHKLIETEPIFDIADDIAKSGDARMQLSYLKMLKNLLSSNTHNYRMKEKLLWQIARSNIRDIFLNMETENREIDESRIAMLMYLEDADMTRSLEQSGMLDPWSH